MGGIGKTALAQKLANELTEYSAVLWCLIGQKALCEAILTSWAKYSDPDFDIAAEERKDIELVARRVQALLTHLIDELCPGTTLVVFDDVWEGEGVRAVRLLQKAVPVNSVTLITTRSQKVAAQLRSVQVSINYLSSEDSLQMLKILLQGYPSIHDDKLLALAQAVGYHPLALELAAGQVSLLERPAEDIDQLIDMYQGGIPAGSPFHEIRLG